MPKGYKIEKIYCFPRKLLYLILRLFIAYFIRVFIFDFQGIFSNFLAIFEMLGVYIFIGTLYNIR